MKVTIFVFLFQKFPRDLKITSLPKAVDADLGENAVVSYDLSSEGLMVFDVDKSTGDITTKISCSQTCILSNDTQFEVSQSCMYILYYICVLCGSQ